MTAFECRHLQLYLTPVAASLLRIASRDLLGDADLIVTTEELSHLADVCLAEAWRAAEAAAREELGAPLDAEGNETGLAVIGMGKLGGGELNYSSDIDLMFVYGADGETAGGRAGRIANGDYFARVARDVADVIEAVTEIVAEARKTKGQ